jgi:hypothetical protein
LHLNRNLREKENFEDDGRKFLEANMNLEKNVKKYEEIFGVLR